MHMFRYLLENYKSDFPSLNLKLHLQIYWLKIYTCDFPLVNLDLHLFIKWIDLKIERMTSPNMILFRTCKYFDKTRNYDFP